MLFRVIITKNGAPVDGLTARVQIRRDCIDLLTGTLPIATGRGLGMYSLLYPGGTNTEPEGSYDALFLVDDQTVDLQIIPSSYEVAAWVGRIDRALSTLATEDGLNGVLNAVYDVPSNIDVPTAEQNADALLNRLVETGLTFGHAVQDMWAALRGNTTGVNTSNPKFRNAANTKDRISATIDENGNRIVTSNYD